MKASGCQQSMSTPEESRSRRARPLPLQPKAKTYVLVHGAWHGGWCWRDVAATRGQSSAQSVEKKRRDDQGRGDAGNAPGRDCRPIRGDALSIAGPSTAAGSPKRSDRLASPRHVAMGVPAARRNSPARAVSRPNILSNGAVRAPRRHLCARRPRNGAQ